MLVAGSISNAVAFTGGQAVCAAIHGGAEDLEKIRHDRAVEAQNKAMAELTKDRQNTLDFINRRLRSQHRAEVVFENAAEALALYNRAYNKQSPGFKANLSQLLQPK
jgi:hypothetical protein